MIGKLKEATSTLSNPYLKTWKNKPLPLDVEGIALEFLARHLK